LSLGALLVLAVFRPEPLAQLRVRFLHRCLTQLARHDVVVVTVGDVGRHVTGPRAALGTAADTTTTALLPRSRGSALAGTVAIARVPGTSTTLPVARGASGALLPRAASAGAVAGSCALTGAGAAAAGACPARALLRHGLLFLAHALVEDRKRFVEAAIDFRALLFGGDGAAARAGTARNTSRSATT